jgi:hypothetical protein
MNFYLFFSLLQINIFLVFLDHFDAFISKMIFKKIRKHYFDTLLNEKRFEKQPQLHSETSF